MAVVITKPSRHNNPNYPVRNDFELEELQPAVEELANKCDEFRRRAFPWYYELGELVRRHYRRVEEEREAVGRSMYGERFFNRLANELEKPGISGQLLSGCFKLVETYGKEEYRKLCEHDAITPTHAMMLARSEGPERAELLKKVISEKLTTKQLFEAEKEMFGVRRMPGAGRPPKRPKKLKDAFAHLNAQAEKFVKLNNEIWFGEAYNIIDEIKALTGGQFTDELKAQVEEAAEHCENLAATATRGAECLRGILPEIERRMKAQADMDAQVRAAEEEVQSDEAEYRAQRQANARAASGRRSRSARREIGRAAHSSG
jgi:hypothetical protein